MNKTTLEIGEYIATNFQPCTLELASRVQNRMADNGIDFSRVTKGQFKAAVLYAYCEVNQQ